MTWAVLGVICPFCDLSGMMGLLIDGSIFIFILFIYLLTTLHFCVQFNVIQFLYSGANHCESMCCHVILVIFPNVGYDGPNIIV